MRTHPYLVGGEDRSYEGFGGRSFVNILRYQYLLDPKSRLGAFTTNRLYNGGGYGHSTGLDGLFLLVTIGDLILNILKASPKSQIKIGLIQMQKFMEKR